MNKYLLFPLALGLAFCTSQKKSVEPDSIVNLKSCPDAGICTTELLKNKAIEIKKDDLGSIYYHIIDSPQTSVIVYQYNLNVEKDIQDANYREEIIFEIKNSENKIVLNNSELQQTKMLFGRFCFCRGQTGYYPINNGRLTLTKNEATISFDLDFVITEVPQIIKSIKTSVK